MKKYLVMLCFFVVSTNVGAKPPFSGPDFSGTYDCTGTDSQGGKYTGTVTIELVKEQSVRQYGAYRFRLDVPGDSAYRGHAAADGIVMAMHFVLIDSKKDATDFGTGIATFKKNPSGKWMFSKYFYQPEFKGGMYGMEECVFR